MEPFKIVLNRLRTEEELVTRQIVNEHFFLSHA